MRKLWSIFGIAAFLAATAGVASAAKIGHDKGNWWSAGAAGSGGYNAPVKAGEFELNFRSQIETDFEQRDNYDFNRRLRDHGTRQRNFTEQETRLGMDSHRGPFKTHILLEQETLFDSGADPGEGSNENSSIHLERAWGEYNFGPFTLRVGLQLHAADPVGIVYADDDWGARLYGDYGDWGWSAFWFRKTDNDAAAIGGDGINNNRDDDSWLVQVHKAFDNPFGKGSIEVSLHGMLNDVRSQRIQLGDHTQNWYVGGSAQGDLGPFKITTVYSFLFGKDNTGFGRAKGQSSQDKCRIHDGTFRPSDSSNGPCAGLSTTPGTGEETNIRAHAAYLGIDYPIPNLPLVAGIEFIAVSGDGNPNDNTSHAYDVNTLFDIEVFGSDYIFADDDLFLIGKRDDEIIPGGLSNVATRRAVNASPARTTPIVSSNVADVSNLNASTRGTTGLSGTTSACTAAQIVRGTNFCKAVRSTAETGALNFSHPGVWGIGAHGIYSATKQLSVRLDGTYWRFFEADSGQLQGFTGELKRNQGTLSRLHENDDVGNTIGWEIGIRPVYKPHPNFRITPAFSVLIPGDGLEDLAGNGDLAWNFIVETLFVF